MKGFFASLNFFLLFTSSLSAARHYRDVKAIKPKPNHEDMNVQSRDMSYYRLPNTTKPVEQTIRLQPFVNGNYTIDGYTEITIEVLQATMSVVLHMVDILYYNKTIKLSPADDLLQSVPVSAVLYDRDREFLIITLEQELELKLYVLSMRFTGFLNNFLVGFYRSFYTDENGNEVKFAVSQFAPNYARYAFPCYDEPAMKAKFKIEILREENLTAISNMPKESSQPVAGQPGWMLDSFEMTVPMSAYLVAFIVSDLVSKNSTQNESVLFTVWARAEAIDQADYALEIGPQILSFYEDYFGIPYPLPKQDMAAVPDFYYGAMENWGLIIYREDAFLYDPLISSAWDLQRVCSIVAHELSHQWYGNLVTMEWWDDVWLNEGFATFMEYPGCDSVEPSFKMKDQFVSNDLHRVLLIDSLESSHPLSNPITSPEQIGSIYDTIAYSKGGSLIRMMNYFLTPATFQQGVSRYVANFSYSSANQNDLWNFLTDQAHLDGTLASDVTMKQIMDTWTLQIGYPVLTVHRFLNGTVLLQQEKFQFTSNQTSSNISESTWWIPLTYTTEDNPDFTQTTVMEWMNDTERVKILSGFPTTDKWIIFNVQENGYYRVNYDKENWNQLIRQFHVNSSLIHPLNRAQILDDGYNMAKIGMLSYEIILSVNAYLDQETDYVPLKTALAQLEYLNSMFVFTAGYVSMKDYTTDLLIPLYTKVGFEDSLNDTHEVQLNRALIVSWTCKVGYDPCVLSSVSLYHEWMTSPDNYSIITPNVRRPVYCTAIADGDETEWDFAYQQYLVSNVGGEKDNLIYGMGCTRQIWLIERYMDLAFSNISGIRKQDINDVFSSISENVYGVDLAWNYIRQNSDDIIAYSGLNSIADLTSIVSYNFNTQQKLTELQQFQDDLGPSINLSQSIERTQNNLAWMDAYYDLIEAWLQGNGYGRETWETSLKWIL